MKIYILIVGFIISMILIPTANSENTRRGNYGSNPQQILDTVVWKANEDRTIQETQLDNVNRAQWSYASEYRIANTLDALRIAIAPYLQWLAYLWLTIATIGIIYNWFRLVTGQWDLTSAQKNITNILLWVIIMTWFYAIIRIFVALFTAILWQ